MSINVAASAGAKSSDRTSSTVELGTFTLGEAVFIRTVTYACTGRIAAITNCCGVGFLHLEEAAYIAVSDRFSDGLIKGSAAEVEPIPGEFRVSVNSVVDVSQWMHPLLTQQK